MQCELRDEDRIPPAAPDDPAANAVRHALNARATAIGYRIIQADDLPTFHRQQATETMGAAIKATYERYFAENEECLMEQWHENRYSEYLEQVAVAESLGISLE